MNKELQDLYRLILIYSYKIVNQYRDEYDKTIKIRVKSAKDGEEYYLFLDW